MPLPMEKLREMANRMNQILTNLLVSQHLLFWPRQIEALAGKLF